MATCLSSEYQLPTPLLQPTLRLPMASILFMVLGVGASCRACPEDMTLDPCPGLAMCPDSDSSRSADSELELCSNSNFGPRRPKPAEVRGPHKRGNAIPNAWCTPSGAEDPRATFPPPDPSPVINPNRAICSPANLLFSCVLPKVHRANRAAKPSIWFQDLDGSQFQLL